jgi:heptosyltransferase-2
MGVNSVWAAGNACSIVEGVLAFPSKVAASAQWIVRMTMQPQQPQRVLVFCVSGLGDVVMASPALAALAAAPQRFRLTLLTMFGSVKDYLLEQGFSDDVRFLDFLHGSKQVVFDALLRLRREQFDVSVVAYPQNRLGYNAVSRFIGARCRIGFRYQRQRHVNLPRLNHVVLDEDPQLHVVQENLRWAAHLTGGDFRALPDDMWLRTSTESKQAAEKFLRLQGLESATPLIGIHPSCNPLKNQQKRCWPPHCFVGFIERMAQRLPAARFLLFEGPHDEQLAQHVSQHANSVAVARLLPVGVVGALIQRCHLFVSNVSGPIHLAAAGKVPIVGIYGPTNPTWDGPWKTESIVVSRHLPCSPCFYYSSRPLDCPARLDYACVRELPIEEVEKAALQLLKAKERI